MENVEEKEKNEGIKHDIGRDKLEPDTSIKPAGKITRNKRISPESKRIASKNISILKRQAGEQIFAENYLKARRNGTEAYMMTFGTSNRGTASVEATRMLQNPNVVNKIKALLGDTGLAESRIFEALNKPVNEEMTWKALQGFARLSLELHGKLADKSNKSVNVGIIIEKS